MSNNDTKLRNGLFTAHRVIGYKGKRFYVPSYVMLDRDRGWGLRRPDKIVEGKQVSDRQGAKSFEEACILAEAFRPLLEPDVPFSGSWTVTRSGLPRVSNSDKGECCERFNVMFLNQVRDLEEEGVIMPAPNYALYLLTAIQATNTADNIRLKDLVTLYGEEVDLDIRVRSDQRSVPVQTSHIKLSDLVKDKQWANSLWRRERSLSLRPRFWCTKLRAKHLVTFEPLSGLNTFWITPSIAPRAVPATLLEE